MSARVLSFVLAATLALSALGAVPAAAATGSITGTAFADLDRDGVRDAGEEPFDGHRLYLFDGVSGSYLAQALTDEAGRYAFTGLPDGPYRVEYDGTSWSPLKLDWVPTTTGTVWPRVSMHVAGEATADFGWRPITWSTDLAAPISTFTGAEGLRVESFNDAVDADELHQAVTAGLVGAEAPSVTVRFAYGSISSTTSSVVSVDGEFRNFHATSSVSYQSWLSGGDQTLSHEYGHAWSLYHAYIVQQDDTFASYLQARGLADDDRVDSSYGWSRRELIAEDYRQLFGSPTAQLRPQANQDIPPAAEVVGLEEFMRDVFTQPPAGGSTDPEPTPEPEPTPDPEQDILAPDVQISSPSDGERVAGTIVVQVSAVDDVDPAGSLNVDLAVDAGGWTPAAYNPETNTYEAVVDTTALKQGTHELVAHATDAAGNTGVAPRVTFDVKNKGGGSDDGSTKGSGNNRGPNK